ncbi:MAG: zf-HC2 domain-containing protein [Planctomycetes bacterium]|nr:zf-HC2 domain-containing protein [Planctomycetota bacterium]
MLTCRELTEIVTEYLERRLSLRDRLRFQMHVGMCFACRRYLRQMRQVMRILGRMPDVPPPTDFREEMLRRFRDWQGRARGLPPAKA